MADNNPFQSIFDQNYQQTPDGRYFLPFANTFGARPNYYDTGDGSGTGTPGVRYGNADNWYNSLDDAFKNMGVDPRLLDMGAQNSLGYNMDGMTAEQLDQIKGQFNGQNGYFLDPNRVTGTHPATTGGSKPNDNGTWQILSLLAPAAMGLAGYAASGAASGGAAATGEAGAAGAAAGGEAGAAGGAAGGGAGAGAGAGTSTVAPSGATAGGAGATGAEAGSAATQAPAAVGTYGSAEGAALGFQGADQAIAANAAGSGAQAGMSLEQQMAANEAMQAGQAAGAGASSGGFMDWLGDLGKSFTSGGGSGAGAAGGTGGNGIMGALANYFINARQSDKYTQAAKDASDRANALNQQQRQPFQQMGLNLLQNPQDYMANNPFAQSLADMFKNKIIPANMAKTGNPASVLDQSGSQFANAISGNYNDLAQTLMGYGGFNQGTGFAGNVYGALQGQGISQMGEAYRGIGQKIFGGIPSLFQNNNMNNVNASTGSAKVFQ